MLDKPKEKILENVKHKISISNFIKEEKIEMKKTKKSILKVASIASLTVLSITGVVFAKEIGSFAKKVFVGASDGVQIAVDNDYYEKLEPEFIHSDGIDIAVDSFLMDDANFAMNFRVKLSDKYNIQNMMMGMELYDLKIVDERGKKVFATHGIESEEMQQYKTEQEAKEKYDSYRGGYSAGAEIIGENEIMYHVTATENPLPFPKCKKLFVTFTRIHVRKDFYEQPLNEWYTGDWKFELDVPEEMYNREIEIYKVKSCSDENTIVEEATLSNTAFKISIPLSTTDKVDYELLKTSTPKSIYDKIAFQKEYVVTSDGKKYEISMDGNNGYAVPEGKKEIQQYTQSFNLTKYDATDELTVHMFTNRGEEIVIVFEKQ